MSSDLDNIFKPRSIAVIGASRDPGSFGHQVLRCLVEGGFQGPLFPVNPRAKVIHSFPCYSDIAEVPGAVDLAVIAIPAPQVPKAVEQCARQGVKGLVIISAGFKEAGSEGEAFEKRLVKIVRSTGMRMIGPNCMGVINTDPYSCMNATFAPASMTPGRIAFMSQSGAMGVAILNYARHISLGLSMYASIGNKADVSVNDLLEYWRDDPSTQAILLYIESFGNPRRFTQIAREITPEKPIIAVKAGRTISGLMAADLHTGEHVGEEADSGSDVTVDALFDQCGVLRVQTLEEMFDLARAIIHQPLPKGTAVGVLTNGGGPGIMAADALEGLELDVPPLDPRTIKNLSKALPYSYNVRNPMDMRADAVAKMYGEAIPALLDDPNLDVLLIIYVGFDYSGVAEAIVANLDKTDKPVLACMMGGPADDPGLGSLLSAGVPVYSFPESACKVIHHLCAYKRYKERPAGKVKRYKNVDRDAVRKIIKRALREEREDLRLEEVRQIAEAYGARVLKIGMAGTEDEAVKMAEQIGYPVVVKVVSDQIRKKSEVGGVKLDLRNESEVRNAYRSVMQDVGRRFPSAEIEGLLVQQMVKGGQELILGAVYDPVFGPVLRVGAGGPYADLIEDFAFGIVPVSTQEALQMIRSLKIYPLLEGKRGRSPIHVPSLVDLLSRASQLIEEFEQIREFEINPLIVLPRKKELWAVDGMMRLFMTDKSRSRNNNT